LIRQEYGKKYNKSKDLFESKKFDEAIIEAKQGLKLGENLDYALHQTRAQRPKARLISVG